MFYQDSSLVPPHIFGYKIDRVVFPCFILVCELQKEGIRKQEWQRYMKGKDGRRDFQIDLAIAIMASSKTGK